LTSSFKEPEPGDAFEYTAFERWFEIVKYLLRRTLSGFITEAASIYEHSRKNSLIV
jgi:hypothetical protein